MSEEIKYKLHRVLDLAIDMSEAGDDTTINISCSPNGSVTIFVMTFDGEYAKEKDVVILSGFMNMEGHSSTTKMINEMKRRVKRNR